MSKDSVDSNKTPPVGPDHYNRRVGKTNKLTKTMSASGASRPENLADYPYQQQATKGILSAVEFLDFVRSAQVSLREKKRVLEAQESEKFLKSPEFLIESMEIEAEVCELNIKRYQTHGMYAKTSILFASFITFIYSDFFENWYYEDSVLYAISFTETFFEVRLISFVLFAAAAFYLSNMYFSAKMRKIRSALLDSRKELRSLRAKSKM
jgi:hypothetical protein